MNELELYHYGVKGMKWGHRKKYYNPDGSINKLGAARKNLKIANRELSRATNKAYNKTMSSPSARLFPNKKKQVVDAWNDVDKKRETYNKARTDYKNAKEEYKKANSDEKKSSAFLKVGVAAAGTTLAVYGTYKLSKLAKEKAFMKSFDRGSKVINDMWKDGKGSFSIGKMGNVVKSEKTLNTLFDGAEGYARSQSRTTKSAIKTLLGKGDGVNVKELWNRYAP